MKAHSIAATVFLLASVCFSHAQINQCGTDLINQQYGVAHPERMSYREQMQTIIRTAYIEEGVERNTIVIPTVVHVMHKGGTENISNTQVIDAIRVLNEDLRHINSDTANTRPLFKPYAADFNIEFRLAKIDPQGNCTNGITNTFSPITYTADDNIKETATGGIDPWPVNKYFNIWVVGRILIDQDNVIGYAYFPSWGMSNNYGVVIDNNHFGTIGSAAGEDGRTLTHEVGHCLELYHTFQSGCGSNCSNSGDDVCDTPPVSGATYSCGFGLNTCANDATGPSPYASNVVDMVENYMSYNQGFCQNIFTKGQKLRSDAVLQNTFLAQLITAQNVTATGTSDGFLGAPCVLMPDFKWSKSVICAGDSVIFSDFTHNGTPDSYQWNITGPQTFSFTGANPTVVFTQPGIYTVTLQTTNIAGTESIVKQNIIRVSDIVGASGWAFFDGFENHPITTGRWQARNPNFGNGWEEKTTNSGNFTVYINNVDNETNDMVYEIYSPVYDLSNITEPKFSFKTAFAEKNGAASDVLKLYISDDCGATWILRFAKAATALASMSPSSIGVEPQTSNDWFEWQTNIPAIMANSTNFMVKFTFETGGGNNIYLDDVNIFGLASINEFSNVSALKISPNPTADQFTLDMTSYPNEQLQLSIYDMSGKNILTDNITGGNSITLSTRLMGIAPGMYRVALKSKTSTSFGKIIVTE